MRIDKQKVETSHSIDFSASKKQNLGKREDDQVPKSNIIKVDSYPLTTSTLEKGVVIINKNNTLNQLSQLTYARHTMNHDLNSE